jgi:hypothetical protein
MPKIESLLYSPLNMVDFRNFCIEGKPIKPATVPPSYETDEDGRQIVGVISWLNGWGVKKAQFFHTSLTHPQENPLQLFIVLVEPDDSEDETRPWFIRLDFDPPRILFQPEIPGIDKQLRLEGLFGTQNTFLSMSELFAGLEQDTDLDAEFAALQKKVGDVIGQLEGDTDSIQEFLAALRSDDGSNSAEVFAKHKFSLRD